MNFNQRNKRKSSTSSVVSSMSLRSSSKRTRLSKVNNSQTYHLSQVSKKIGKYGKKIFKCLGCSEEFQYMWSEPYQFIKYHVKINEDCKKYYPQCPPPCSKIFYEESNLKAHQQRSAATSSCYKSYSNKLLSNESAIKYTTSEVEIPIREEKIYTHKRKIRNSFLHLSIFKITSC